jgi:putative oxidoreductase
MQRLLVAPLPGRDTVLSVLRIMVGLCFLQHGLQKLAGFPPSRMPMPEAFTLMWYAGVIEVACGTLLVLGLLTRPAAFIAAGHVAFAYFISHWPRDFFPVVNGGTLLVVYCFTFLYVTFAGPGRISLDNLLFGRAAEDGRVGAAELRAAE